MTHINWMFEFWLRAFTRVFCLGHIRQGFSDVLLKTVMLEPSGDVSMSEMVD